MAAPSMLRIERLNYILGGVLVILAALTQTQRVALGVAIGVAVTCANFHVLRRLVTKWTSDAAQGKTGSAPLLMMPKMIGLMGAVAVAILLLPIDPIAFVIGYSLFIVSIVIDTTYSALRPQAASTTSTEHDEPHG
ncbi:MAG: ATP synthase subunit I [Kofleriaceae bacterium]|nr:ATP synthase subunit I [Kofleriaceae bacterium]